MESRPKFETFHAGTNEKQNKTLFIVILFVFYFGMNFMCAPIIDQTSLSATQRSVSHPHMAGPKNRFSNYGRFRIFRSSYQKAHSPSRMVTWIISCFGDWYQICYVPNCFIEAFLNYANNEDDEWVWEATLRCLVGRWLQIKFSVIILNPSLTEIFTCDVFWQLNRRKIEIYGRHDLICLLNPSLII